MNLKSLFNKKQEEKPTRDLVDFLNDSNYLTSELRFQHQLSNIQMRANKNEKVTYDFEEHLCSILSYRYFHWCFRMGFS